MKKFRFLLLLTFTLFIFLLSQQMLLAQGTCSWSGTWETEWGELTLFQQGNIVTGNYTHDNGKISATASGNTLHGSWSEAPSYKAVNDDGDVKLTMAPDCQTFKGDWRYGFQSDGKSWSYGDWKGKRLSAEAPAACSWNGTWDTNWGELTLYHKGNTVTGNYSHDNGKISATTSGNTLHGNWSEAPSYSAVNDAGEVILTITPDCKSFTGDWRYGFQEHGKEWSKADWKGTKK